MNTNTEGRLPFGFFWLVMIMGGCISFGLILGAIIDGEIAKNICLKHEIIKYHPDTGKLKIQPEYTNSNYEYLKELPGTDLEWWE